MSKLIHKEAINAASLVFGILIMFIGFAIRIGGNFTGNVIGFGNVISPSYYNIFTIIFLVVGAFLALMGGFKKWK